LTNVNFKTELSIESFDIKRIFIELTQEF